MASIGTGAVTGITIWVVADGRYEPQNFPFFHIDDSQLVWDWSSNISNYTTLRVQKESTLKNAGWEIESSIALNEQVVKNTIMSGGRSFNNGLGSAPVSATQDYLPIGSADAGAGAGDAGYESADQVRDDDINTLFAGLTGSTVRVTRIRSDIAQAAMTADFILQASADQSELSNIRNITQSVNLTCPIYDGCNVIGTGTLAQAQASVDGGGSQSSGGSSGSPLGTGGVPSRNGAGASGSTSNAPAANGSSGCATSPQGTGSGVAFGALAGLLALVVGRVVRVRRRRAR
jgi:MYXO-CTERM domain-containing protein